MALPILPLTKPACLAGLSNGKLPDSVLVDIPGLAGGPTVRLVEPAARGWRALTAGAAAAGHIMRATSLVDSYRPYAVQERIFRERYQTTPIPGAPTRTWQGQTWYQRPGTATAAVPGKSNHGLGLAVDVASVTPGLLSWLIAHETAYGWSHELESEPWHIRYVAGDDIPPAVIQYEQGATMAMATAADIWTVDGVVPAPTTRVDQGNTHWSPANVLHDTNDHARLASSGIAELATVVARLEAAIAALPTGAPAVDPATIRAEVRAAIADLAEGGAAALRAGAGA